MIYKYLSFDKRFCEAVYIGTFGLTRNDDQIKI